MSAGWAGGAAGGPLQAAHPGVGGLPQPLYQLPRGLAQHALVPAPVLLVDGSAPRALRRPQIRWGELAPSTLQYFGQYFYVLCVPTSFDDNCFSVRPLLLLLQESGAEYRGPQVLRRPLLGEGGEPVTIEPAEDTKTYKC